MEKFLVLSLLLIATFFHGSSYNEIAEPLEIIIPKLNVKANIEAVGLDEEERMESPKDIDKAGWYKYGAKPGEKGNAVIAGHRDSSTGPALFYKLGDLEIGDKIIVTDRRGVSRTFEVFKKESYDAARFPLEAVFGSFNEARLNLITCEGIFDKGTKDYSKRVVVYSELL